jgi:hypothetical protein
MKKTGETSLHYFGPPESTYHMAHCRFTRPKLYTCDETTKGIPTEKRENEWISRILIRGSKVCSGHREPAAVESIGDGDWHHIAFTYYTFTNIQ